MELLREVADTAINAATPDKDDSPADVPGPSTSTVQSNVTRSKDTGARGTGATNSAQGGARVPAKSSDMPARVAGGKRKADVLG